MSDIQQWYYADATGQQYGPITVEQLQQLVATGQVNANTQVWTEGLEAYVPASQVEGLIPATPVAQATPAHQPQINLGPSQSAAQVNPYAPSPVAGMAGASVPQQGGEYPIPLVGKVNFKLYLWLFISGALLYLFGLIKNVMDTPTSEEMMTNPNALQETSLAGPIMLVLGFLLMIVPGVMNLIFIHRAWTILKPGGGTISPGMAIGLMFIPLFGSIWALIVLFKLPGEWNNIVSRYTNTISAPRLSIGTVFCMMFIPVIGAILWAAEVTKGINFMANARLMPAQAPSVPASGLPGTPGTQSAPGDLKLY